MLKDKLQGVAIGVVSTAILMTSTPVMARTANETISVSYNNIKLIVDGQQVQTESEPFVYNGKTYLSVRDVASAVGKSVNWDGATQTIYLGANTTSNTSQVPTTQINNQQPQQQTVTVNTSDAYATAINNLRNSQQKTNAAISPSATTEYTRYTNFAGYLNATNQLNYSLNYRPPVTEEERGRATSDGVNTHYYKAYYFNEFLQSGMTFIPYPVTAEKGLTGYTVVATAYDRTKDITYLEIKKDSVALVRPSLKSP